MTPRLASRVIFEEPFKPMSFPPSIRTEAFIDSIIAGMGTPVLAIRELLQFCLWTGATRIEALLLEGQLHVRFNASAGQALRFEDYDAGLPLMKVFMLGDTVSLAQNQFGVTLVKTGEIITSSVSTNLGEDALAVVPCCWHDLAQRDVSISSLARDLITELLRTLSVSYQLLEATVRINGTLRWSGRTTTSTPALVRAPETFFRTRTLEINEDGLRSNIALRAYRRGSVEVVINAHRASTTAESSLGGLYGPGVACIPFDIPVGLVADFRMTPTESFPSFQDGKFAPHNREQLALICQEIKAIMEIDRLCGFQPPVLSSAEKDGLEWLPSVLARTLLTVFSPFGEHSSAAPNLKVSTGGPTIEPHAPLHEGAPHFEGPTQNALVPKASGTEHLTDEVGLRPSTPPRVTNGRFDAVADVNPVTAHNVFDLTSLSQENAAQQAWQPSSTGADEAVIESPLEKELEAWLSILSGPEKELLTHRYGLHSGKRPYLNEIAALMNISVEFAKTLEKSSVERLKGKAPPVLLIEALTQLLESYAGVSSLSQLATAMSNKFPETRLRGTGLAELVAISSRTFSFIILRGVPLVTTPASLGLEIAQLNLFVSEDLRGGEFVSALREQLAERSNTPPPTSNSALENRVDENRPLSPFEKARSLARALQFTSLDAWDAFIRYNVESELASLSALPNLRYFETGWRGWSDWLGLPPNGVDPQLVATRLAEQIPAIAFMQRADVVAELKRLELWRYPLLGTKTADEIVNDILSLPFTSNRQALIVDIVDRIDRALVDNSAFDELIG